jgi:hypothetical protein
MTLLDLKHQIAAYFQLSVDAFTVNVGTVGSPVYHDILTPAINTARLKAEREHDFQYSKTTVNLAIPSGGASSGVSIANATLIGDGAVSVKRIRNVLLPLAGNTFFPCEFLLHDEYIKRQRRQIGRDLYDSSKTLGQYGLQVTNPVAYIEGQILRFDPPAIFTGSTTVRLAIVRFMPDYTTNTDTDYFIQYGFEYLQWQSVLEVNKVWRRFAPRQEGNIDEGNVEALAAQAMANFVQWDIGLTANTSTPMLPAQPPQGKSK